MTSKKFVLFLVEGYNDKQEIEAILHTPFFDAYRDKYVCRFIVAGMDITADSKTLEKNILHRIEEYVNKFRKNSNEGIFNGISPSDIQEIVHVTDTDGAFIPRDGFIRGDVPDFFYREDAIVTSNVDALAGRNRKKQSVLRRLISVERVAGIKYSIYFVSKDMDHVLFNKPNSKSKRWDAKEFGFKCTNNPDFLKTSLFNDKVADNSTYEESWKAIQEGYNSLKRRTNFNLYFSDKARHAK